MYIAIGLIALFVEMIIACILKDFIMLGIIIITIGFLLFFSTIKGYAKIKGAAIFMTVYCFLWGMGMTGLSIAGKFSRSFKDYDIVLFIAGLGFTCAGTGIYMGIIRKFQCTHRISACYDGAQAYTVKAHTTYTPQFSFTYNGEHYSNTSGECFSERKLNKHFQTGKSYPIYINPKNPNCFCISRMINKEWILLIMLGILFLFVSCNLMIGYFTI